MTPRTRSPEHRRARKSSSADGKRPAPQPHRGLSQALCTEHTHRLLRSLQPPGCHATPCSPGDVRKVPVLSGPSGVRALLVGYQTVLPEGKGLARTGRKEPGGWRMGDQGPAHSALRPDPGASPATCHISAAGGPFTAEPSVASEPAWPQSPHHLPPGSSQQKCADP